jgi:hypothetical protein
MFSKRLRVFDRWIELKRSTDNFVGPLRRDLRDTKEVMFNYFPRATRGDE